MKLLMTTGTPLLWFGILGYVLLTAGLAWWFVREWNQEYWKKTGFGKARWSIATKFILVFWGVLTAIWGAIFWWG